jgi:hypothetical protein
MEGESEWWQDLFGELRPWKKSDSAVDRLAWISISKLPFTWMEPRMFNEVTGKRWQDCRL